jgi:hypothetical protein
LLFILVLHAGILLEHIVRVKCQLGTVTEPIIVLDQCPECPEQLAYGHRVFGELAHRVIGRIFAQATAIITQTNTEQKPIYIYMLSSKLIMT